MSREQHFKRLNHYRHSREYAEFALTIGTLAPGVDPAGLPSLIGARWQIDDRIYHEFLEMLPPLGWSGGGTFYMREFTFANITTKYTREGDRYFCEFARYPARRKG